NIFTPTAHNDIYTLHIKLLPDTTLFISLGEWYGWRASFFAVALVVIGLTVDRKSKILNYSHSTS
ncbi:hypothetical protein QO020_34725, partial [Pseudomonas aeruginosa]